MELLPRIGDALRERGGIERLADVDHDANFGSYFSLDQSMYGGRVGRDLARAKYQVGVELVGAILAGRLTADALRRVMGEKALAGVLTEDVHILLAGLAGLRRLELRAAELSSSIGASPTGMQQSEGGKPNGKSGGRRKLCESNRPADLAKRNVYELVRAAMAKDPTLIGPMRLIDHFRNNTDFKQLVTQARLTFGRKLFRAATKWINENSSHKTQSRNVS